MAGHLFVTHGDITRLACDAWLLPSDIRCSVTEQWFDDVSGLNALRSSPTDRRLDIRTPGGWADSERAMALPEQVGRDAAVWLGNVGAVRGEAVAWYAEAATQFLDAFARSHDREPAA